MCLLPPEDPQWTALLAAGDVDDAFNEWQERQDRLTEFGGAGALEEARKELAPGSSSERKASDLPAGGSSRTTESFSPARRIDASPSAAGLLLLPGPVALSSPRKVDAA